jgi:hypothetical protein
MVDMVNGTLDADRKLPSKQACRAGQSPGCMNRFFRDGFQNGFAGRELSRLAYLWREMTSKNLNRLVRIMVNIDVKVKITIVRK